MAKLLQRTRAWLRRNKDASAERDKDWKTVGKTFRATDAAVHNSMPMQDDGRPRH